MIIGVNASAAVKKNRTGVEEYVYQLIRHLAALPESKEHRFFLYIPGSGQDLDFSLPENFIIKKLWWPLPFFWTQIRLSWEMLVCKPDVLFIPVHILPWSHPEESVVAIHGLEYEYLPECYPLLGRIFLRWSTKFSASRSSKIITVSENTKKDLIKLYKTDAGKIKVIYHGFDFFSPAKEEKLILLYLGRIEQKKNIQGIVDAYGILREKYKIPHKLVLAGGRGYGYEKLKIPNDVIQPGFVSQEEKQDLLNKTAVFLFPGFYEGFGLPILEAQAAGVPVVTSFNSSMPEVAGEGALFVNPRNPAQIAEAAKKIIDEELLRDRLIQGGYENIKRFSWEKCARETLKILTEF